MKVAATDPKMHSTKQRTQGSVSFGRVLPAAGSDHSAIGAQYHLSKPVRVFSSRKSFGTPHQTRERYGRIFQPLNNLIVGLQLRSVVRSRYRHGLVGRHENMLVRRLIMVCRPAICYRAQLIPKDKAILIHAIGVD